MYNFTQSDRNNSVALYLFLFVAWCTFNSCAFAIVYGVTHWLKTGCLNMQERRMIYALQNVKLRHGHFMPKSFLPLSAYRTKRKFKWIIVFNSKIFYHKFFLPNYLYSFLYTKYSSKVKYVSYLRRTFSFYIF